MSLDMTNTEAGFVPWLLLSSFRWSPSLFVLEPPSPDISSLVQRTRKDTARKKKTKNEQTEGEEE